MLALTMGDPAGIGGELTVSAWHALRHGGPAFTAIDDPARLAGTPVRAVETLAEAAAVFPDALPVLPQPLAAPVAPGRPDRANAAATIASIERAVQLAQTGEASAVVTNPISKAVLYAAGFPHPGHTEFLGALTGCAHPVMMLANDFLRVVPVTVHVSLRAALDGLTTAAIVATARTTVAALRGQFGIASPRLAMAGSDADRPGHRGAAGRGHRRHRAAPAGHHVHPRRPCRLRRGDLHVP